MIVPNHHSQGRKLRLAMSSLPVGQVIPGVTG